MFHPTKPPGWVPATAPVVLGVGYADMRKGFDLFLQLWRIGQLQDMPLHCIWVGGFDPALALL